MIRLRSLLPSASAVLIAVSVLAGCGTAPIDSGAGTVPLSEQTDNHRRAQIRLQLAIGYYQQGQMAVALEELRSALQSDPNFADAYSMRALIYMELGETALAEENFSRALKLTPNNPELANNYGWFLCQNGKAAQSLPYFATALKNRFYQSPTTALNNAGVCSLKIKDTAAAERHLIQAFEVDPSNPTTNVNLANLYYGKGDYQRAHFYIQRALKTPNPSADALWTGIKIERKLGDRAAETSLLTQLRRNYPKSPEFAAYLRGTIDE